MLCHDHYLQGHFVDVLLGTWNTPLGEIVYKNSLSSIMCMTNSLRGITITKLHPPTNNTVKQEQRGGSSVPKNEVSLSLYFLVSVPHLGLSYAVWFLISLFAWSCYLYRKSCLVSLTSLVFHVCLLFGPYIFPVRECLEQYSSVYDRPDSGYSRLVNTWLSLE